MGDQVGSGPVRAKSRRQRSLPPGSASRAIYGRGLIATGRGIMASTTALLGTVPMFKPLDSEQRAALAALLEAASYSKGETIFRQGDPGDCMYVVCSGLVEISTTDKLGQKIVLIEARPGDIFGE